ncbi:hypothetical protein NL529_31885, partial [Klebsiella pneumoniae]|nr:hypothetical protein [Klebsiella pneumoniae]
MSQLMSLGYGRSDVHPTGTPLLDANLHDTRRQLEWLQNFDDEYLAPHYRAIVPFVKFFDSGPL